MDIKKPIKKALEILLVTTPLWAPFAVIGAIESHYNHLSREEKIAYLENQLNTTYKSSFPPVGRGAVLFAYNISKGATRKELERLKSNP